MARPTYPAVDAIAKAFENDPRTKVAQLATQQGASTAPVAGGGWAWVDGLSRVLQGALGGHVMRQQQKKYGEDEAALLASAQAQGKEGLASMAPPAVSPPPAAPQAVTPPPAAPQGAPGGMDPLAVAQALQTETVAPKAPSGPPAQLAGIPIPNTPMEPGRAAPLPTPAQYKPQGVVFTDPLGGRGGKPTSGYGPRKAPIAGASTMHNGVDYAAKEGTPVQAAAEGKVIAAWNDPKGGLSVRVRHPDGSITGYAHLSALNVKQGDTVAGGQPIGAAGSTGNSTGSHLHFTYRDPSGKRVDPSTLKFSAPGAPSTGVAPSGAASGQVAPEVEQEVPVPEAMARPDAPTAEAATQSRKLRTAYEMLQRGNKYEYERAMKLLQEGLAEQGSMDESATDRRQRTKDTTYQSDLSMYANDKSARLNDALTENRSVRERNWRTADREDTQAYGNANREDEQKFNAEQAAIDRSWKATQAELDRNAAYRNTLLQIEASKATREEKQIAKANAFYTSPQGIKVAEQFKVANDAAGSINALAQEFQQLNQAESTGGLWGKYAPNSVQGSINGKRERMIQIGNQMAQSLTKTLPGSLSNADLDFLRSVVPNVANSNASNNAAIRYYTNAAQRQQQYAQFYMQSLIDGDNTFPQRWSDYVNTVGVKRQHVIPFEKFSTMRRVKM